MAILFGLTIGFSRVVLGVHSWNQVFFGWSLGIWIAFTLHFCVKDQIVENAWKLLQGEDTRHFEMMVRCVALMIITYSICIFDYWLMDSLIVNDEVWWENIHAKCPDKVRSHAFQADSIRKSGVVAIAFGSYLGLVF